MSESSSCINYCQKTGECLLDKIEYQSVDFDEYEIVTDLKVAYPKRAKAFDLFAADTQERLSEEFWSNTGEVIAEMNAEMESDQDEFDDDFVMEKHQEAFAWSDSIECSKAVSYVGPFAITTEIRLDDLHTDVIEM